MNDMALNTTGNIIEALQRIGQNSSKNKTINIIDTSQCTEMNSTKNKSYMENKNICRMVRVQLTDFYDDIYIPFAYFRNNDWKISKVLYNNEDVLFYNEKYLTDEDKLKFYEIFDKFINMVEEILSTNTKLYGYLTKWTDKSEIKWKSNNKRSYLKTLFMHRKYQIISPAHTTNLYCEYYKKYKNDLNKIESELEKHLDGIIDAISKRIENI